MDKLEIQRFPDDKQLADAAAMQWLGVLRANHTDPFVVALSGGRISRTFFSTAANLGKTERRLFDRVHFFWGDERCVPPTDPESNYRIARDLLFSPLGISESHIHRIRGEDTPSEAAQDAAGQLRSVTSNPVGTLSTASPSNHIPLFDLVFLGMGEDGHTASLFPEETPTGGIEPVYRAVRASKPPPERITLGYNVLMSAKDVWVLASGVGKENALRESVKDDASTPLGRVINGRSHTKIFTDIKM